MAPWAVEDSTWNYFGLDAGAASVALSGYTLNLILLVSMPIVFIFLMSFSGT